MPLPIGEPRPASGAVEPASRSARARSVLCGRDLQNGEKRNGSRCAVPLGRVALRLALTLAGAASCERRRAVVAGPRPFACAVACGRLCGGLCGGRRGLGRGGVERDRREGRAVRSVPAGAADGVAVVAAGHGRVIRDRLHPGLYLRDGRAGRQRGRVAFPHQRRAQMRVGYHQAAAISSASATGSPPLAVGVERRCPRLPAGRGGGHVLAAVRAVRPGSGSALSLRTDFAGHRRGQRESRDNPQRLSEPIPRL